MDDFDFYKELYHKENDRRTEVLNSMNIPVAIITALSTAIYFVITTFDYKIETFLNYIFCGLCSVAIICILLAIYFLIRAFSDFTKGYEYSGIPYPNELLTWYNDLKEYYLNNNETIEDADQHFKNYLVNNFAKHANHNMFVNDKKYGYIYMSKKFLIIGLVITLVTMIPFGYNYFNKKDTIHKVELTKDINQVNDLQEIKEKVNYIYQTNILKSINNEREREKAPTTAPERQVD